MAVQSSRPDLWSRWFFRGVQLLGCYLGVHEATGPGRPFVLLFSGALILGSLGVRALVKGAAELAQQVQEADNDGHG